MSASSQDSKGWELVSTNKQHGAAMRDVEAIASSLADLSRAAATLGNPTQSDMFWTMHLRLCGAYEAACSAFARELYDHFKSNVQASANMVGAAMAVDQKRQGQQ